MPVEIRHVEYVLAITSGMSMRKASESLYVSEPTMSTQIRVLEAELGVVLFDRAGRVLRPTDEYNQLREDFQRLIAARNEIIKTAQRLRESIMKSAKFVPTAGHLMCPHCGEKITASNGVTATVHETAGQHWAEMAAEKWQCGKCHRKFALPANPFRVESEASV